MTFRMRRRAIICELYCTSTGITPQSSFRYGPCKPRPPNLARYNIAINAGSTGFGDKIRMREWMKDQSQSRWPQTIETFGHSR
jgi:hypothetical protein